MSPSHDAAPNDSWGALAASCLGMGGGGGGVTLSSRLRNALFVLFIGGLLAYGAGFAWYMLARFDLINLIRDVSYDDAFYYFQIARNLAEGKFSTFDGGITRTNGYHPLWMLLITPFYWIFDKEAALFGIKAFEIMLVAGGVALVTAAVRVARLPWYLMFAALPMLYQNHALIIGMEAAAGLFLLGLFILTACLFARSPARWRWPLAAVAFALPWVRLEYIAVSLAATAALCLIEWSRQERVPAAPLGEQARSALSAKTAVPFLTASAGILVYFAYNGLVFGGIVPVSGATKVAWSKLLWEKEGGYSLAQNFREVLQIPAFDYELLVALEVCAYLLLVWWFTRRARRQEDWLLLAFLAVVSGLAAGHLAKFAQTVLTLHPSHASSAWHFVPAYLLMALIVPVRCYVAIYLIRRFIGSKSQHATNILSVGIVLAGAAFLFAQADFTEPFQRVERQSKATIVRHWNVNYYTGTLVANRLLPDNSIVGSWDAGAFGYFSRFPVVNLDGLVNSYNYYFDEIKGRDGYRYYNPIYREFGITHLANQSVEDFDNLLYESRSFLEHRRAGLKLKLISAEPPEDANTAVWVWKRMEPRFDYQSDGAGFLVDGRLVQSFAKECDPDELVVWSWVGPGDGTVASAWTQTRTGLCVGAFVLPHDAPPPVSVETMPVGDYLARLVGDSLPVIRSDWDVYLVENSLIYVKEQCRPEDVEPTFFLHLNPVDANDLPSYRKQYRFDNLDFAFSDHVFIEGGVCLAKRELPDYGIATVRTGQSTGEGRIWKGRFDIPL